MLYKELFIGIDISKLKHDIAIFTAQKRQLGKCFVVRDDRAGYEKLVDKIRFYERKFGAARFYIGMEATSDYWKNIYWFLKKTLPNGSVTVINPIRTKRFADAEFRRAHTDPVNAKDIARFMVEKRPQPSQDRPAIFEAIKDVDTQTRAVKKQKNVAITRLRIELSKVAPEIEKSTKVLAGQQILALLGRFSTAELIANATVEEMRNLTYGQRQWHLPLPFIEKMKALAQESVAHKTGSGAEVVVQSLVRQMRSQQEEVRFLNEQIRRLYQQVQEGQSLLTTIKGIGKETGIVLEAYIGDVSRFANEKKIVAYFGMNPTVYQSGEYMSRNSRLEKKGSGVVRHKLYMATLNMIRRKDRPIYQYYQHFVDAGRPKLVAIGAAMRKLLVIMYTMLKNQTAFDPDFEKNKKKK